MRRRDLVALAGGVLTGLAGCLDGRLAGSDTPGTGSQAGRVSTPTPERRSPTATPIRDSIGGIELPVPRSEFRHALPRDHIPAITDPAFAEDWTGLDVPDSSAYDGGPLLPDDSPVIGVERRGDARAYPLRVLDWHEVVNDEFEGPLLVTYCPICGSGVAAERRVDGRRTLFGVTGLLWRHNLVMYDDHTDSRWSQLLGAAIRGPRAGEQLSLMPTSLTTWREWRDVHPATEVLLPPPASNTVRGPDATFDYFSPKYGYGDQDGVIGRENESGDPGLHPRTLVIGVTAGGVAKAYPFGVVRERDVINDRVGDRPVVVSITPGRTLVAYRRAVAGETVPFEAAGEAHLRAAGSRWERASGRAVDGPHEGVRLSPATEFSPMFWRGWSNRYPETAVYG